MQSKLPNQICLLKASIPRSVLDKNLNGHYLAQAMSEHYLAQAMSYLALYVSFVTPPNDLFNISFPFWFIRSMKAGTGRIWFTIPWSEPRSVSAAQQTLIKICLLHGFRLE